MNLRCSYRGCGINEGIISTPEVLYVDTTGCFYHDIQCHLRDKSERPLSANELSSETSHMFVSRQEALEILIERMEGSKSLN